MDSIFNNIMTPLGMVVWSHGPAVISALLGAIILCIFGLMLISFHSPKDAVANEVGNVERIEGVLRQILSEQNWPSVKTPEAVTESATTTEEPAPVEPLASPASEVSAEAAPAPTPAPAPDATASTAIPTPADTPPSAEASAPAPTAEEMGQMQNKIKELEEKLAEYSVIEEDIADLSKFRQENDELKKKISHATGVPAEQAASMPWDDFEKIVQEKGATPAKETVSTSIEKTE